MKYYKVYEIIEDNFRQIGLKGKTCVGIFKNEDRAKYLTFVIDVQDCNKTEIKYEQINKQDLLDLHKCFKGSDCTDEIIQISKNIFKTEDKEFIK